MSSSDSPSETNPRPLLPAGVSPYFEKDGCVIIHGDCRDVLPHLPPVDLVLTDPPYGMSYRPGGGSPGLLHSRGHKRAEVVRGDDEPFDPAPWLAVAPCAFFGAQWFFSTLPPGEFFVWDKRGDYRPIDQRDFDLVWTNAGKAGRIIRCVWRGLCRETEAQDKILHPTQKPVRLMRDILDALPPSQTILDPFMGSGTTLVAARDLGRKAIGVEICEKYCEIAAKRLAQGVLPFGGEA